MVVPAHRIEIIAMIAVRRLHDGDECELCEIRRVMAGRLCFLKGMSKRRRAERAKMNLVGIDVHEPVGLDSIRDLLLSLQNWLPRIDTVPGKGLDTEKGISRRFSDAPNRCVRRLVVDQIDRSPLCDEISNAVRNKALFVVDGENCDDFHRVRPIEIQWL